MIAGIIANPASGKDIRRLVAHATVFDNQEKVNLIRRILLGFKRQGLKRSGSCRNILASTTGL